MPRRGLLVLLAVLGLAAGVHPQQVTIASAESGGTDLRGAGQPVASAEAPPDRRLPGSIHGVIRGREGSAYEGARVALTTAAAATSPAQSAISDSAGQFNFADVPPGAFTLTISTAGFATQTIAGSLAPGQALEAQPIVLLVSGASTEVVVSASQVEIAQEQLHEEEQQRVLGVIPNFYVAYAADAVPLTPAQKLHLSLRSLIDPTTMLGSAVAAGIEQKENDFKEFGQGTEGYSKRFVVDYADNLVGTMIGSVLLPTMLKQDPRYFYKGTGTVSSRFLYAIANSVICKGDSGQWQPNYSRLVGGLASAGISELYYPSSERKDASTIFENFAISKGSGAIQNIMQEFVVRKFSRRLAALHHSNP